MQKISTQVLGSIEKAKTGNQAIPTAELQQTMTVIQRLLGDQQQGNQLGNKSRSIDRSIGVGGWVWSGDGVCTEWGGMSDRGRASIAEGEPVHTEAAREGRERDPDAVE